MTRAAKDMTLQEHQRRVRDGLERSRMSRPFETCTECGDAVPAHRGSRCPRCGKHTCERHRPSDRHDCDPTAAATREDDE
jgi:rRNA maturation endonuclease Nob1